MQRILVKSNQNQDHQNRPLHPVPFCLSPISSSRSPQIPHHALLHQETQLLSQLPSDHHTRLLPSRPSRRIRSVQQTHLRHAAAVELRSSIISATPVYNRAVFRRATAAPPAGDELGRIRRPTSARPEAKSSGGAEVVEYMSVSPSIYLSVCLSLHCCVQASPLARKSKKNIILTAMDKASCNIALVSYNPGNKNGVGESLAQWSTIFTLGTQLVTECLIKGQAGGSAIIPGKVLLSSLLLHSIKPTVQHLVLTRFHLLKGSDGTLMLSLFLWEDGAWFDDIMNEYWGTDSPVAIDPLNPLALLSNANTTGATNQTLSIVSAENISTS